MGIKEFNTPILLITFNRPQNTRRALESILAVQPNDLYVFQDGAREGNVSDVTNCAEVRQVIEELTEGEQVRIHKNYQETNLGCGPGPYKAITWFFENEELGIILEDDINPHPLFFSFMGELLERFKKEESIGMVTAHNLNRYYSPTNSYYFTPETGGTLGWGTWRRVWEKFDFNIPFVYAQLEKSLKMYRIPRLCRRKILDYCEKWLHGDRHDCWDYQFEYFLLVNNYLNARANSCLTSHEGNGKDATHFGYSNPNYYMDVNVPLFENIRHPSSLKIDFSVRWRMFKKELHLMLKKMFLSK